MDKVASFLQSFAFVVLVYIVGYFIGKYGFKQEKEEIQRLLHKPKGAVFTSKSAQTLKKEQEKEFYNKL